MADAGPRRADMVLSEKTEAELLVLCAPYDEGMTCKQCGRLRGVREFSLQSCGQRVGLVQSGVSG